MATSTASIETQAVNTIRCLSMDGVQAANSGHPGTPMALAPVTYCIWNDNLRYDPQHPGWPGRDRFVLSCGHASMLLYSILHVTGVSAVDENGEPTGKPSLTLDNLKNFRQMESPCAGHPEYGEAAGIETTTGPLGQGVGNSVGMAIAAKYFAAKFDRPGHELFGYDTYALCSDGDLMEGVACEGASIAGHLKLSNLCWIYDDNKITIEGDTDLAFTEDVAAKFEGLGWNTLTVEDANDLGAINAAIENFKKCDDRPTLIVLKSIIAWGSPNKANTHGAHGSPLGDEEISLTKQAYGWPDEKFLVPDEVRAHFDEGIGKRGADQYADWQKKFGAYKSANPELAAELEMIWSGKLPDNWDADIPEFPADAKGMATRASSGKVLNGVVANLPWFIGGSADLAPSTLTLNHHEGAGDFSPADYSGKNFHFGIREHGMAAACNGISLSGLRPYCATFFVFTDYLRPSLRLSSIMHQGVVYIMTHDSIGLGEDGPTHQPIEHLAACRAIPGVQVIRPGDANEVAYAYRAAISSTDHPTVMVCSRQGVPTLDRSKFASAEGVLKGGYVLAETGSGDPDVVIMATGTEVQVCIDGWEDIKKLSGNIRLVSMPCMEIFDAQDKAYRDSVLPPSCTNRIAVEAGIQQCWDRYLGFKGVFIGMSSFGASAPAGELYEHFGITGKKIAEAAGKML